MPPHDTPERSVIYGLHASGDTTIRYVGQTCHLRNRVRSHQRGANGATKKWCSGVTVEATVLEECTDDRDMVNHAERDWYERLLGAGAPLLNRIPPKGACIRLQRQVASRRAPCCLAKVDSLGRYPIGYCGPACERRHDDAGGG